MLPACLLYLIYRRYSKTVRVNSGEGNWMHAAENKVYKDVWGWIQGKSQQGKAWKAWKAFDICMFGVSGLYLIFLGHFSVSMRTPSARGHLPLVQAWVGGPQEQTRREDKLREHMLHFCRLSFRQ